MNILMNTSMIDEKWCYPVLKKYIKETDRVCVLAFSFFDDTKNIDDWNKQYAPGQGIWYRSNTDVFFKYGIPKENITWVNYFKDARREMIDKIEKSNILLLTGGAPDLMMKRIKEKGIKKQVKNYQGLVIGYSAGAMIQLDQYHITPDEDYPEFGYYNGLGMVSGFDIECHYKANKLQINCIERVQNEKRLPVYAIYEDGGVVVHDSKLELFGNVECYDCFE